MGLESADCDRLEIATGDQPANVQLATRRRRHHGTGRAASSTQEPVLIVLEATGGLELPVLADLGGPGYRSLLSILARCATSPKAVGKLAKTDAIDAQVLAHFADAVRPPVRPLPDATTQVLTGGLDHPPPTAGRDAHRRGESV